MPTLYLNNFRGFKETFLPLKNVNFFVGENSTGKTSVLKVIELLASQKFWETFEFNGEYVELGHFSEIANNGYDFFEIGFFNEQIGYGIKLTFVSEDGLAALRELMFTINDTTVICKIEKLKLSYASINQKFDEKKWFQTKLSFSEFTDRKMNKFSTIHNEIFSILLSIFQRATMKDTAITLIFSPQAAFVNGIAWLAPIRTEPRRTYDSYRRAFNPDGTHTPYILKDLLSNGKKQKVQEIIQKFGQESGLFEKIEIVAFEQSDTSPFEIRFYLNGQPLKITNVGYGISQVLPIITEIVSRPENSWFAIQQPEIHLHPKAQAAFGEFIFSFLAENKNFIIETHSDYIIDRFRLCTNRSETVSEEQSQVVFFQRTEQGNKLTLIPIAADGSYPEDQPKEFQEFFIKEQLNLLSI